MGDASVQDYNSYNSYNDAPDVPIDSLILFDPPDVFLRDLAPFVSPDIRLEDLRTYDTAPAFHKGKMREWSESLVSTVVFVLLFTGFIAQATQVPTESMKPTILVGDHFFLDKVAFPGNFPESVWPWLPRRNVQRGDIIAFKSPVDTKIPFVKRVIAVGGDTLEIRNKIVLVNGKALDEPYKIHTDQTTYSGEYSTPQELLIRDNYGPTTVPEDHFFVMGDNRDNSNDSRFWGFVDRSSIIGKPLFVYWSYESDPYIAGERSWVDLAHEYLSIASHFFTRTRWFRMGTLVE